VKGKSEAVKDRWIFCLRPDAEREGILRVNDESLLRRFPWAQFREKHGGDFKRWRQLQTVDAVDPVAGESTA
jgi:hypothetical protein